MGNYNITKYGLIFLLLGIILEIITLASLFLTQGEIQALGIINFVGNIFTLVGLILMIVGGFGLKEYGKTHGTFTMIALIIFIAIIVVSIIFTLIVIFSSISSVMISSATTSADISQAIDGIKTLVYLVPIVTIMGIILHLFLLYNLEDTSGKIILLIALIVGIIASLVVVNQSFPIFDETIGAVDVSNFSVLNSDAIQSEIEEAGEVFTKETSVLKIYLIIHNILLMVAILLPFIRMSTGKLTVAPRSSSNRKCSNCGFDVPQYSETCPKCGQYYGSAPMQTQSALKFCPNCGHKNEEDKTFCEECGTQF